MLAPGLFVGREIEFVAVEVNLVGEDAHAQLGAAGRQDEETRLQPDRQQHERQVARTQ